MLFACDSRIYLIYFLFKLIDLHADKLLIILYKDQSLVDGEKEFSVQGKSSFHLIGD